MAAAPELTPGATVVATGRPGWLASRWERLNGPRRIAGVDLARGLAVLGMLAAHLIAFDASFDWGDSSTWLAVVDGRSSILFATLAGVSIGLVTGGRTPLRGSDLATVSLRLVIRALLLWILGALLIATGVPVYVILPAYAILFLLALPLVPLSARVLFPLAGALALVMPFVQVALDDLPIWSETAGEDLSLALGWHYPFPVWIAFVVAGLALVRAGVLRLGVQLWALAAGVALAVAGYGADALVGERPEDGISSGFEPNTVWTADPHSSGLFEVIGSGGFALAAIAASLLACRTLLVWIVLPVRAVGAMPLTAYTAQLAIWAVIAAVALGDAGDLSGFRAFEPFWPMTLGILAACTAWALLIGRGPVEWAFDRISRVATLGRRTAAEEERR